MYALEKSSRLYHGQDCEIYLSKNCSFFLFCVRIAIIEYFLHIVRMALGVRVGRNGFRRIRM